jgi:ribosomal-protein-alanine N-acetyltransferase
LYFGGILTPTAILADHRVRIRGPRLTLRYPEPADAPALFALASDPAVTEFFSWGPYADASEARAWIDTLPERRRAGTALEFAVTLDDSPIGITLLSELDGRDRRGVVGTWLGRAHWGTGANQEVKALMACLAFSALGLERLGAYADVENVRSQRALERIGFRREGVLRAFHRHYGRPRDVVLYALLADDWRAGELARHPCRISGLPAPR